jgi:hypothetical protein
MSKCERGVCFVKKHRRQKRPLVGQALNKCSCSSTNLHLLRREGLYVLEFRLQAVS